jgi:hypothetical protein
MTIDRPLGDSEAECPAVQLPDGWVENCQWLALDARGIEIVCHIGTHASDPSLWHVVIGVSLSDGTVYLPQPRNTGLSDVAKSVGPQPDVRSAGTALHGVRCEDPYRLWNLGAHGGFLPTTLEELAAAPLGDRLSVPLRVSLQFQAFGPVWQLDQLHDHPEVGHFHYEQPMQVSGVVHVGGEAHSFNGYGYRDHSRGPRHMGEVAYSSWCNGVFPSGRTFGSLVVTRNSGETLSLGALLHRDGAIEPAQMPDHAPVYDAAHNPRTFAITLIDRDGRYHGIEGRVAGGATWSIVGGSECCLGTLVEDDDAYILPQSLIRWEWDGEVGYGLADRCANIRVLQGR